MVPRMMGQWINWELGAGWILMLLFWFLGILGIVLLIRWLVTTASHGSGSQPMRESALDILKKRDTHEERSVEKSTRI